MAFEHVPSALLLTDYTVFCQTGTSLVPDIGSSFKVRYLTKKYLIKKKQLIGAGFI